VLRSILEIAGRSFDRRLTSKVFKALMARAGMFTSADLFYEIQRGIFVSRAPEGWAGWVVSLLNAIYEVKPAEQARLNCMKLAQQVLKRYARLPNLYSFLVLPPLTTFAVSLKASKA
jgi:hypothetical protein